MVDSVLAIDLGKTGCRAQLWVGANRSDAAGLGAPGLATADGDALAEAAILAVALPLLRAAGVAQLEAVGVGAAGALASPTAARALAARLCDSLPADEVAVTSDAVTSHAGALGGATGVVLAVGTGCVALAVAPDGAVHRADGWGPWLGDEGGGAWLGLAGLRAALRAADGRGPATQLRAAAEACFVSLDELSAAIEGHESPPRHAAGFAAAVVRAAEAGDAVATTLVGRAVAHLAGAVRAVAAPLAGSGRVPVAVIGGLTTAGTGFMIPLAAALDANEPPLERIVAQGTATDGARLLALHRDTRHEASVVRTRGAPTPRGMRSDLDRLATERVRPGLEDLDQRSAGEIARLVVAAELAAHRALAAATPRLAQAADAVAARMLAGGRLFTLGAGTPGRLAVLDAAELGPTYNAPDGLVIALLAGGPQALVRASEGAEDDVAAAAAALDAHRLGAADSVIGITASGRTPYVVAGLHHARGLGALTVAVVNNPASPAAAEAEIAVEILTGAELIAGSTRMTAGTTQKIALVAISTAVMVALGKTYGARMVDVRATNDKLRRRALRMVQEITGADAPAAEAALAAAGGRVKPAVVSLLAGIDIGEAELRLDLASGRVRDAILRSF